jgi:hypothetical protein
MDRIDDESLEERQSVWQLVPKLLVLRLTEVLNHAPCVNAASGAAEQDDTLKTSLPSQQK